LNKGILTKEHSCLAIMLKYPEPGKVKTRLGREIGMDMAARLYRSFVSRLLETCSGLDSEIAVCCHPERDIRDYECWLGKGYKYIPQAGKDLGLKMRSCFEQCFDFGFSGVILMGSDIPQISPGHVKTALARLDDHEAVIGPAMDGGYYLLGMREKNFLPEVFTDISWSTSQVYEQTMEVLTRSSANIFTLPVLMDVDTLDDLRFLFDSHHLPAGNAADLFRSIENYISSP